MKGLYLAGLPLLLMAGGASPAAAQGVVEYGAATASKTAGASAKKIGNSLDKILKKAGDTLEGAHRGSVSPAAGGTVRAGTAAPAQVAAKSRQPAGSVVPSPEAFGKLEVGTPAEELEARLGPPSFRVVIPEPGRLVEIYQYAVKGRDLGTVRVVDGKVAEVRPAEP